MLGGAAQRSAVATFHVPGPGHHRGAVGSCRAAVGQTRLPREQSRQLVGNGAQCTPRGSVASAGPPGLGRAPAAQPLTLALHPHRRTRWRTTWTRPSTCCAATPWALQATCTGCCPATGLWPPASPARSCRWVGGTTAWCVRGPERGRQGGSRAGPDSLPGPQVGGSHSEDSLAGSSSLLHSHVALPGQPSVLPDLSRPPDSYSGESQRHAWAGWQPLASVTMPASAGPSHGPPLPSEWASSSPLENGGDGVGPSGSDGGRSGLRSLRAGACDIPPPAPAAAIAARSGSPQGAHHERHLESWRG